MKLPTPCTISNVEYKRERGARSACLACEFDGARYHVWVEPNTLALRQRPHAGEEPLYKNPPVHLKTTDEGFYWSRKLSTESKFAVCIIVAMREVAQARGLVERDRARRQAEREEQDRKNAEAAALYAKEQAAPAMYDTLRDVLMLTLPSAAMPDDATDRCTWYAQRLAIIRGRIEDVLEKVPS